MENHSLIGKEKELYNCYGVKTLLMLVIVLYHSMYIYKFGGGWPIGTFQPVQSSRFLSILIEWMATFHNYSFVLVSGYVYYYLRIEMGKYANFWSFVLNKIKRLIVPYFFAVIMFEFLISLTFNRSRSIGDLVHRYVLAENPAQLWFLWMLFWVSIFSYLLTPIFEKNPFLGAVIVAVLFLIGRIGSDIIPNYFKIFSGLNYVFYYWLGFNIRKFGSKYLYKIPTLIYFLLDIALFAVSYFVKPMLTQGIKYRMIFFVSNNLTIIVGVLMVFVSLQKLLNYKNFKFVQKLTPYSMGIYLVHLQIIYLIIFTVGKLNISPYIFTLIAFIVSTFASVIIVKICSRFKITRFLMGE